MAFRCFSYVGGVARGSHLQARPTAADESLPPECCCERHRFRKTSVEDTWAEILIGELSFTIVKACACDNRNGPDGPSARLRATGDAQQLPLRIAGRRRGLSVSWATGLA